MSSLSSALRVRSFHSVGALAALALALPLTLVACGGGGEDGSTGGASGAGGSTGGAGGAGGATGGAGGATGGSGGATGGSGGATGGSGGATGGASGAGGASGGSSGAGGAGGSGGAAAGLYGSFIVELVAEADGVDAFTRFSASLFDGEYPPAFPLTLDTTEGDCQLWVPTNASCPAGCSNGVCEEDGVCTPYPAEVNGGPITVTGIEGGDFTVTPVTAKFVYMAPAKPNPPCEEGAAVGVTGTGFTLATKCIKPLVVTTPEPIPVMSGSTVDLAWEAAGAAANSRIAIKLDIAHHGGRKGEIQCDVPDTGSFSMPAALVSKLIALGLAGYPTIGIKRITTVASTEQPGLAIVMASPLERGVDTGVTSCVDSSTCPDGQTCTEARLCEDT